mmetsp:Transcript_14472/g.21369  ORF Transcript_14472/g.21369 Transcript_14472/m.21369 type:complete len:899 (+) Transcript_14472:29-2725(+)
MTRMRKAASISLFCVWWTLASFSTAFANASSSSITNGVVHVGEKYANEKEYTSSHWRGCTVRLKRAGRINAGCDFVRRSAVGSYSFRSTCRGYHEGFVIQRNSDTQHYIKQRPLSPSFFVGCDATKNKRQSCFPHVRNMDMPILTPTRRKILTKRNLRVIPFSLNLNNSDEQTSDEELPSWLRALKRWQFLSGLTVEDQREMLSKLPGERELEIVADTNIEPTKGGKEDNIFLNTVPLAGLVNVEALSKALLLANSQDNIDLESDSNYFNTTFPQAVGDDLPAREEISVMQKQNLSLAAFSNSFSKGATPLDVLPSLLELGDLNKLFRSLTELQDTALEKDNNNIDNVAASKDTISVVGDSFRADAGTDSILKETTAKIEKFLNDASSIISPASVQDLIFGASRSIGLKEGADGIKAAADGFANFTDEPAFKQGLDEVASLARVTTQYTTDLVQWANSILLSGYVGGSDFQDTNSPLIFEGVSASKPLFHRFTSVQALPKSDYRQSLMKATELSKLAGAIYQNIIPITHSIDHAIVANGTTADVAWMVTDSIAYEDDFTDSGDITNTERRPMLVRTLTIRGYDAADENVDREKLINLVCQASPEEIGNDTGIVVHSGLLSVAQELYKELKPFIDASAPAHKIVLTGHSIGGSLSILVMLLLVIDYGADVVNQKIMRVFTFGSPPVAMMTDTTYDHSEKLDSIYERMPGESDVKNYGCHILGAFGLRRSIVYGYVQPWDPIIRLFSRIDPLYPLVGDLGEDGVTLYASGPPRTLRPITRAILESWQGWPDFRDNQSVSQTYGSIGVQHLLMPDPTRYLTDRLVSVNVGVPPIHSVLRISSEELLPALEETFPLDIFGISLVPTALRSFIHHFFPAYMDAFIDYTNDEDNTNKVNAKANV